MVVGVVPDPKNSSESLCRYWGVAIRSDGSSGSSGILGGSGHTNGPLVPQPDAVRTQISNNGCLCLLSTLPASLERRLSEIMKFIVFLPGQLGGLSCNFGFDPGVSSQFDHLLSVLGKLQLG